MTGADGKVAVDVPLEIGTWQVTPSGSSTFQASVDLSGGGQTLVLHLPEVASRTVHVQDQDGIALSGVQVTLTNPVWQASLNATLPDFTSPRYTGFGLTTDGSGDVALSTMPMVGTAQLTLGSASWSGPFDLRGTSTTLTLTVPKP